MGHHGSQRYCGCHFTSSSKCVTIVYISEEFVKMFWFKKKPLPSVTFATCCWERDWQHILLDPLYLSQRQIANHLFPFAEKLLVINNVSDLPAVCRAARYLALMGRPGAIAGRASRPAIRHRRKVSRFLQPRQPVSPLGPPGRAEPIC